MSKTSTTYLREHQWCELGTAHSFRRVPNGCLARATHAHHILTRARGGKDEWSNYKALCAPCHQYAHEHSAWATEHGFLRSAMKAGTR